MTTPETGSDLPDYLSFADVAVDRTVSELPSVDPVSMRLVLTLHRLTNALIYDLESTVHRPRGWSWAGFRVMFVLWLAGPCSVNRVATLSGMSRAAVSALVGTLQKQELVLRERSTTDRRAVDLRLTDSGREAIVSTYAEHNLREQRWAAILSPERRELVIELLDELMRGAVDADVNRRS